MLEQAVTILESAILKESPGYSEKTFHIEPNKVLIINEVRYEIDILISIDVAPGYTAVFIFECRNWKKKTNKNDIVGLIDKIKVVGAQSGYYVARQFTRDAKNKSKEDPRVRLLKVSEIDFSEVPIGFQYLHGLEQTEPPHYECNFKIRTNNPTGESAPVDASSSAFVLDAQTCDMNEFIREWGEGLVNKAQRSFASAKLPEGNYRLPFEETREFERGYASLNGDDLEGITLSGYIELRLWRGVLESRFEVASRGRVYKAVVKMLSGEIRMIGHEIHSSLRQKLSLPHTDSNLPA